MTPVHAEITTERVIWLCEADHAEYAVDDNEPMLSPMARAFIHEHTPHILTPGRHHRIAV